MHEIKPRLVTRACLVLQDQAVPEAGHEEAHDQEEQDAGAVEVELVPPALGEQEQVQGPPQGPGHGREDKELDPRVGVGSHVEADRLEEAGEDPALWVGRRRVQMATSEEGEMRSAPQVQKRNGRWCVVQIRDRRNELSNPKNVLHSHQPRGCSLPPCSRAACRNCTDNEAGE